MSLVLITKLSILALNTFAMFCLCRKLAAGLKENGIPERAPPTMRGSVLVQFIVFAPAWASRRKLLSHCMYLHVFVLPWEIDRIDINFYGGASM